MKVIIYFLKDWRQPTSWLVFKGCSYLY